MDYPASTSDIARAIEDAGRITDAELEALALAADPDQPVDPDAVPLNVWLDQSVDLLPGWYMAPITARRLRKWPLLVALVVIASFVVIEAFGLCSTYGQPPFH